MPRKKPDFTPDDVQPDDYDAVMSDTVRQITTITLQVLRDNVGNSDSDRATLVELVEEYAAQVPDATLSITDLTTYIVGNYTFHEEPTYGEVNEG